MVTLEKIIKYFIPTIFLISVLSLLRTTYILWNTTLPDLDAFYKFSHDLLNGSNPYLVVEIFTPPVGLMFFFPLLFFSIEVAQKVWLLLSIILFCISLYFIGKTYKLKFDLIIVIFSLIVVSFPFKFTLGMGQTNMVLLFMITSFLFFLNQKNKIASALSFSFSIVIKLIPSIFIFELIFLKKWKIIFFTLISLLFLYIIPIFFSRELINLYYLKNILFPLVSTPASDVYYNQSITGLTARYDMPFIAVFIVRLALILFTLITSFRNREKPFYVFPLLLTGVMMINTFTWQHQLILLVIPFSYLLSRKIDAKKILMLLIIFSLLAINIKNPDNVQGFLRSIIFSHGFFGIFLLWITLMLNGKK